MGKNTTTLLDECLQSCETYVKANGTVRPSLNPNVASEIVRGSICHLDEAEYAEENCDDDSDGGDDGTFSELRSLNVGSGA